MKIAIVDDNANDIIVLRDCLEQYRDQRQLQAEISSYPDGRSFLEVFEEGVFSICFLDICMDELDGLSVAARVREKDARCLIVFTTTSVEYAVESYRVRAFHYLLKPLTQERVFEVMDLCDQALARADHYIQVKCSRELVRVPLSELIYTDYSNHYIYLYTKSTQEPLRTGMTFSQFSPPLLKHPQFLNCYRNMFINMDEVSRMEDSGFLMSSGVIVPMWRDRKAALRQRYAEYMFRKLNGR